MRRIARPLPFVLVLCAVVALVAALVPTGAATPKADPAGPPAGPGGWLAIDYGPIVDGRALSHSGEPVSALLTRLDGRPLPEQPGERPEDLTAHILLDPLLEPYAFVMPDTLDALLPDAARRSAGMVEIGSLYAPGEPQPAWAELLRARSMILESDGKGALRAFLPVPPGGPPQVDAETAARAAWEASWPVVRHVLAAEFKRTGAKELSVGVHAFRHEPARTRFTVGAVAVAVQVQDTLPRGLRPPLDLQALERFLARGTRLEGARLEADGTLRLFGSETATPPTLAGRPIALSDLAVAYRAVAHGGVGSPYMSLDRGFAPQVSLVNYGGRLRDTALGMVSLLCDVRFKTFSQGIDPVTGTDVREALRGRIPGFATHIERFSADPGSSSVSGQQTRLWFYPDTVDLVLSEQGDVMALRRARMAAASERVDAATMQRSGGELPRWTRDTVLAINREYEAFGASFPELRELDDAARLLALFTWLQQARAEGLPVPALEDLLAVTLPAMVTPRTFPQLLTVNALPPAGGTAPVVVIDRSPVTAGLDRLAPADGRPLAPVLRLRRALLGLERRFPEQAALAGEIEVALARPGLDDATADVLAYRAERARMQMLSLGSLTTAQKEPLVQRSKTGEALRVFTLGIGGLDLGMGGPLARARRGGARLAFGGATGVAAAPGSGGTTVTAAPAPGAMRAAGPRDEWKRDPAGLPVAVLPWNAMRATGGAGTVRTWSYGEDGPEARARRIVLAQDGRLARIERWEDGRTVRVMPRLRTAGAVEIEPATAVPVPPPTVPMPAAPASLALLEIAPTSGETPSVTLRLTRPGVPATATDVPRAVLQRLVLGRAVDTTPDRPLGGLDPLPGFGPSLHRVMLLAGADASRAPWDLDRPPLPGEEDAVLVAGALARWWAAAPAQAGAAATPAPSAPSAVAGIDFARSIERWTKAPLPASALLLVPDDAFPGSERALRDALVAAWGSGRSAASLDAKNAAPLVVLASAEPAGSLARRLRALAEDPAMNGRLLAVLPLGGRVRPDLPASLLGAGRLAGLGVAEYGPSGSVLRAKELEAFGRALATPARDRRVEDLPPLFTWIF